MPSYGGNACINSIWVNYYIIAFIFLRRKIETKYNLIFKGVEKGKIISNLF